MKKTELLKNKKLLSFKRKTFWKHKEISINFETATKNIMIFGGTGSGKTSSIMLPAFFNFAFNNCPGLILDIKGGFSQFALMINEQSKNRYENQCLLLGTSIKSEPFNIIAGIEPYKLREFLSEVISNLHKDAYWGMNGIEDIILIYEVLLDNFPEEYPTLADLYYFAINKKYLPELVKNCNRKLQEKVDNRIITDLFSVFAKDDKGDLSTQAQQRTWQFGGIFKFLKPFYEDPYLKYYFCQGQNINFDELIYDKKKIIVLDLPVSKYGETSVLISRLLRAMFKDTIKTKGEAWLQAHGYGKDCFTFMLIDEYQQFISSVSSPSLDDNNWFDTSRGYGHINIVSTQSVDSLISKTDESYTNQLMGNCRNIIHLGTHASHSLNHILQISNNKIRSEILKQNENLGFCFIGQNQNRKGEHSLFFTCQSKELPLMNKFIQLNKNVTEKINNFANSLATKIDIDTVLEFSNTTKTLKPIKYFTNEWQEPILPTYKIPKHLFVATTKYKSDGFEDFNYICNELGLYFESVTVLNIINKFQEIENENLYSLITEKPEDSLLVFVRGGHIDIKPFFHNTNSENFEKLCSLKLNNHLMLGIGYGHKSNFQNNALFNFNSITPTHLPYLIFEYFYPEKFNYIKPFPETDISHCTDDENNAKSFNTILNIAEKNVLNKLKENNKQKENEDDETILDILDYVDNIFLPPDNSDIFDEDENKDNE